MTRPVTDPVTGETTNEEYEYEEEVPYAWTICHVTLENPNLSHVPVYIMRAGQLSLYTTHIVFAPKYRRMAIYGQIKQNIGQI